MKRNNDWRSELEIKNPECYERLCECRNTKHDILIIAKLMYRYNQDRTKEDCLDRTIEWITDWNNQIEIYPNEEDYQKILLKMC
jgi:hypothetical protein